MSGPLLSSASPLAQRSLTVKTDMRIFTLSLLAPNFYTPNLIISYMREKYNTFILYFTKKKFYVSIFLYIIHFRSAAAKRIAHGAADEAEIPRAQPVSLRVRWETAAPSVFEKEYGL